MTAKTGRPVIAFDLDSDGHHPSYLQYLAIRWLERAPASELVVVVARDFPQRHPDVVALAHPGLVRFHTVDRPEPRGARWLRGPLVPLAQGLLQWRLLQRTARMLRAQHAVVMYLDQMLQGPLALGLRPACPLSGIYFRPAFHYPDFSGATESETPAEAKRSRRQKLTVKAAIQWDQIHTLWTLDPYAVPALQALGARQRVYALADPVPEEPPSPKLVADLKGRYGLDPRGHTVLLFGALTERKGVGVALAAMSRVAPDHGRPLTALVVGRAPEAFEATLTAAIEEAEAAGVRVVRQGGFIPESEVQAHFAVADIVMAPYQRHVGSSGIAIRAARAGKQLVASDYGMLGESVRRENLGVAVDASDAGAVAQGLQRVLRVSDATNGPAIADAAGMARFAGRNTAKVFADTIIDVTTV